MGFNFPGTHTERGTEIQRYREGGRERYREGEREREREKTSRRHKTACLFLNQIISGDG